MTVSVSGIVGLGVFTGTESTGGCCPVIHSGKDVLAILTGGRLLSLTKNLHWIKKPCDMKANSYLAMACQIPILVREGDPRNPPVLQIER